MTSILSFFKGLDSLTIALSLLSFISAVLAFSFSILDNTDERKKYIGLKIKTLKLLSIYITLFLTMFTILLQSKIEGHKKLIENEKEEHQRDTVIVTLGLIEKTINTQRVTLDSVKKILVRQDEEIDSQKSVLNKQSETLLANDEIIRGQDVTLKNVSEIMADIDPAIVSYLDVRWAIDSGIERFLNNPGFTGLRKDTSIIVNKHEFKFNYPVIGTFKFRLYVTIFFLDGSMDTSKLISSFYLDTLGINDPNYSGLWNISSVAVRNLKPILSIRSDTFINKITVINYEYDELDSEISSSYHFHTQANPFYTYQTAFSLLQKRPYLVVVTEQTDMQIKDLTLTSYDKHKLLSLRLDNLIYQRTKKLHDLGEVYQKFYIGDQPRLLFN